MHGIVMVWFFLIPSIPTTLGNFLLPLMIGARDLAFPRLNILSWYLFMIGGSFVLYALFVGGIDTGWTFYTPFSTFYSNGHVILGVVGVFIAGFSSILTGLNFIVTDASHARARADLVPAADLRLVALFDLGHSGAGDAGAGDARLLLIALGAAVRRRHLRSAHRRRSAAVPAPVLVLLAPGRLHHDPAGHGRRQRDHLRASRASRCSATSSSRGAASRSR